MNEGMTPADRMDLRRAMIEDAVVEERARRGARAARRLERELLAEAEGVNERDREQAARQ